MKKFIFLVTTITFVLCVLTAATGAEGPQDRTWTRLTDEKIALEEERLVQLGFEELMDRLEILPGMTILDIGTGSGQYAWRFAERVTDLGHVFATDVNIDMVNHVKQEAARRGLQNVTPTLVDWQGVDPFYEQHVYDIIFVSHTYRYIENQIEYFMQLRSFLNFDGKLVIVGYDMPTLFSADHITDLQGLEAYLDAAAPENSIKKGLSSESRLILQRPTSAERDAFLRDLLADNLSQMMKGDLRLYTHYITDDYKLKDNLPMVIQDRTRLKYVLLRLKQSKTLQKEAENLLDYDLEAIWGANRMLISAALSDFMHSGVYNKNRRTRIQKSLEAVGYRLLNEYEPAPAVFALVFSQGSDEKDL